MAGSYTGCLSNNASEAAATKQSGIELCQLLHISTQVRNAVLGVTWVDTVVGLWEDLEAE